MASYDGSTGCRQLSVLPPPYGTPSLWQQQEGKIIWQVPPGRSGGLFCCCQPSEHPASGSLKTAKSEFQRTQDVLLASWPAIPQGIGAVPGEETTVIA